MLAERARKARQAREIAALQKATTEAASATLPPPPPPLPPPPSTNLSGGSNPPPSLFEGVTQQADPHRPHHLQHATTTSNGADWTDHTNTNWDEDEDDDEAPFTKFSIVKSCSNETFSIQTIMILDVDSNCVHPRF